MESIVILQLVKKSTWTQQALKDIIEIFGDRLIARLGIPLHLLAHFFDVERFLLSLKLIKNIHGGITQCFSFSVVLFGTIYVFRWGTL